MSVGKFHHRSTTKASKKPFKTKHASKSAVKERAKGKVGRVEVGGGVGETRHTRHTRQQHVMSKLERRRRARQVRQNKLGERREESSVFAGKEGAARIVAVVPLCEHVESEEVVHQLNSSVDVEEQEVEGRLRSLGSHGRRVEMARFKTRVQYLTPPRDLFACMDACRVADFVLFVLSAEQEVDALGEQILRCIESQGASTVLTGVHGLDKVEAVKKRAEVVRSLKSYITHFFPMQDKVHDLSCRQDCTNVMRSLCTTTPKGIRWREDRSWMYVDEVQWEGQAPVITGTVRGRALKADRLVQVGEWGDLQIDRVTAAPLERSNKMVKTNEMAVDESTDEQLLDQPSEEQDDLAELAPEESMMEAMSLPAASIAASDRKHVLLDEHHYFDEDDSDELEIPKRLPRGTSNYQSAWYLGDLSDPGSDMEDIDRRSDGDMDLDATASAVGVPAIDGDFDMREPTEAGAPSEYPQTEGGFEDAAPEEEAQQIAAYRKHRREEAEDDLEFPDEIELHPHVNARERLARYRGLKGLRSSRWETEPDLPYQPAEWCRLLDVADYKSAKNRVLKDALTGGVEAGTRVNVHLRLPPEMTKERLQALPQPTAIFGLLKHEHKLTLVNASITLSSDFDRPLKSKEELIMQCGPRRLVINPLFSQAGNTPNDVHKFDRYLHPGRTAVVSLIGPVVWGSVPILYFKRPKATTVTDSVEDLARSLHKPAQPTTLELIGTGTMLPASTNRIIAKRIILTGHPYKIHKRLVTVRYMFFNDADVEYFKALQLWTRRGRSGFIKEPLGTHGYFKATFDGKINPLDAVAVSLYKRVWPRRARVFREVEENLEGEEAPQLVESMAE